MTNKVVKLSKAAIDKDVTELMQHGSDFAKHMQNGDFDAAQADLDARDVIVKRDRQAWDLASKKHEALEKKAA